MADSHDTPDDLQFSIQRIYTKNISLELPNAPEMFRDNQQLTANLDLNIKHSLLSKRVYEVVLSVTLTAKVGEKTAYLCEVEQAGIFLTPNIPDDQLEAVLEVGCANILYPYASECIASLVARSSFPNMSLSPINFEAIYHAKHAKKQEGFKH
jgi:preprotein translocase subunit SecB